MIKDRDKITFLNRLSILFRAIKYIPKALSGGLDCHMVFINSKEKNYYYWGWCSDVTLWGAVFLQILDRIEEEVYGEMIQPPKSVKGWWVDFPTGGR